MPNSLSILPLSPSELQAGMNEAISVLHARGLTDDEGDLKLGSDFDNWLDDGTPNDRFPADLEFLLNKACWAAPPGKSRARCYSSLINRITTRFAMTRRDAAIVLSQLPLILHLAEKFRASPANIARLLRHAELRVSVGWRLVEVILNSFDIECDLDARDVADLIEKDKRNSNQELGDSTVETIVEMLVNHSENLGLDHNFQDGVERLFLPNEGSAFIPYLQILLYICTIDEFFDHPPEYIYTFKPRGMVANMIFSAFSSELAPGGNPILNNFKAVDRITLDWAESREDNREQARALVEIVGGLSSLAYSPRIQISSLLRKAIIRFIEINTPSAVHLAEQTDFEIITKFVSRVAEAPTCTRGVIEQRVVDFLAAVQYPHPEWRSRGLGDPVCASNTSSRKLGDCDFQKISERKCVALEAHAGRLTDIYVKEHLRTLRMNLAARLEEWSRVSEVSDWNLELRFLVHEDARTDAIILTPEVVSRTVNVLSYNDYFHSMLPIMEHDKRMTINLFNKWVINTLDAANTPIATKEKARSLLEP